MDKEHFVLELKLSLTQHYRNIQEEEQILSFGIYTDGDAGSIGIYYNTYEHLQYKLKEVREKNPEELLFQRYYLFFMEEWKKDISAAIKEDLLNNLNDKIYAFGSREYDNGNENYKDEIFDLFVRALKEFANDNKLLNTRTDFFLHLEVSDSWIGDKMLKRISTIHPENRFAEYQEYVKDNNQY